MKLSKIYFHFLQVPPPKFESALCFGFYGQMTRAIESMKVGDALIMSDNRSSRACEIGGNLRIKVSVNKVDRIGWRVTKLSEQAEVI